MTIFQIYKASAGSGKTYTLVKEYIKCALSNNSKVSQKPLLAITFTNKAASEMKTRIIDALFNFSKGRENIKDSSSMNMYDDLKKELGYDHSKLVFKSSQLLSDIIHYYSLFSVSTIDKFIHKIIRGFTYELDLPSNFEVEMDGKRIIEEAVYSLLDNLESETSLTKDLIRYSSYKTVENKNWDIEQDLIKISTELFKDTSRGAIDNLTSAKSIKDKQKELRVHINSFEQKIKSYYNEIKTIIGGIADEVFIYQDLPRYLLKLNKAPYVDIIMSQRLQNSVQNNHWYKKTESESYKKQIDLISSSLCKKLKDLISFIQSHYSYYLFYRECYSSFFLLSVLIKIDKKINEIKKANSIIHISQFNQIILSFLKKNPAPYIYEKIGARFDHYFIDEFQDTSIIQWNNLVPLLEEALSVGGSCLIVGDGKQSIYRWRGGEVSQFLHLCHNHNKQALKQFPKIVKSLNVNYRSASEIVHFNNEFFSFLSHKLSSPYNNLYDQLNQSSYALDGGYVEISILDLKSRDIIDATLQLIYHNINDALTDKFNFSDIVILTRSNKEIGAIASFLTKKGIPIISSESLLLKQSPTVQFILDNFRIFLDESDYLAKAKLIEYLIFNDIIHLELQSPHEIIANFSKTNNLEFEIFLNEHGLSYNFKELSRLNIYELAEQLIRLYKIDKSNNQYVLFLLDFIYDFSVRENNSINDFLNFWNQKKDSVSIVTPSAINAVEIMTIHKSKGLQFPIVIFPFANWKEDLGKDKEWFNVESFFNKNESEPPIATLLPLKKSMENWPPPFPHEYDTHQAKIVLDNINLLYVAMTRPKKRLYIISNSDSKKGQIYAYFDAFLREKMTSKSTRRVFVKGERFNNTGYSEISKNIIKPVFISKDWRHRIRIKNSKVFNVEFKDKYSIHWGDLIHEIMAAIKSKSDIDSVLEYFSIKKQYGISTFNNINLQITRIMNNKKVKHLFQPNLNTFLETSILDVDGSIYRPDRVIVHDNDTASLIDYKTGKEKKSHFEQMDQYKTILIDLGYEKIEKYLIYLTTGTVKQI